MKKNLKLFLPLSLIIFLLGFNYSCSDDKYVSDDDDDYIELESSVLKVGRMTTVVEVVVTTNVEELVIANQSGTSWCSTQYANGVLKITIEANPNAAKRSGGLLLKGGKASQSISIEQDGKNAGVENLKEDIKLTVVSGVASTFQPNEGIEKSFDGNSGTIYHSKWSEEVTFPATLEYNLGKASDVDYIIYNPRTVGSNGNFGKLELHATVNGASVKVGDYDFEKRGTSSRISFGKAMTGVTAFKFVLHSGAGNFLSCSEMEFFTKNPDAFDPSIIFEDLACTKVKKGMTEADLNKIENVFFRDLALDILRGSYTSEFRIQDYTQYEHPDVIAAKNKTSQYSLRDNPTGMYVNEGDDLVVFANKSTEQISLYVQDLSGKGFEGGDSFVLEPGYNKFKVTTNGLIYVMNYTKSAVGNPTTVHIATGEVNGYFDSKKHKAEDWNRLLLKARYRDFDVVGEYSHMTFPTAKFTKNTSDGMALIKVLDDMVRLEQEFMGLKKYTKAPTNRVYFMVDYPGDGNMWATSYRTGYVMNTMDLMTNAASLKKEIWGPAHEVGHVHQTRPAFRWAGTTEVTNNIHSMYVQTEFGNQSRLITDNVYSRAMTHIVSNKNSFAGADIWFKLVPFWQLQLYISNVLDNKDFYKDIYEYYRTNPELNTSQTTEGVYQLLFTEVACDKAKLDLTSFFEAWGFFMPVDIVIDDYASYKFTITQAQIDATKARIAAKGYAKPKHNNIDKIMDSNVNDYK